MREASTTPRERTYRCRRGSFFSLEPAIESLRSICCIHRLNPQPIADVRPSDPTAAVREYYMKILDHEPQQWFLVQDGDAVLLDVTCSHGAFDYDFQLELNDAEKAAYAKGGHTYLNHLAYSIHYSAPGVIGSASPYKSRKLEAVKSSQMQASILSWVRESGPNKG